MRLTRYLFQGDYVARYPGDRWMRVISWRTWARWFVWSFVATFCVALVILYG